MLPVTTQNTAEYRNLITNVYTCVHIHLNTGSVQ